MYRTPLTFFAIWPVFSLFVTLKALLWWFHPTYSEVFLHGFLTVFLRVFLEIALASRIVTHLVVPPALNPLCTYF